MTIWILAILLMVAVALAGWRQGAIRAAFSFAGILFAALLAVPLGHLVHPLLPHLGVTNPLTAWAVAPIVGFIIASIPLKVAAFYVHERVEYFYKYKAGDLRLSLWSRLNTRLGICVGLLNGAAYFILLSFFIFNIAYCTTQTVSAVSTPPFTTRLVNALGTDLQAAGFSRTATAIGTLPADYYRLADLGGLLAQNPQVGPRLAEYPGLASLWRRDDMQALVSDAAVTNALTAGTSLSELMDDSSVQSFLQNKELTSVVRNSVLTNLDDLTGYLTTGKSAKYDSEPIIGNWQFNPGVTLAWLRQDQPKISASEMRAARLLWSQAYAHAGFLFTGDNQIFIKNFPKFVSSPKPNQPPFQLGDGRGDWSRDGANYTLHVNVNGDDKYLGATTDGLRLRLKDGHNQFIFDHAD